MTKKLFFGLAITLFVFWFAVFYGAYKIVDSNSYERGFSDGAEDTEERLIGEHTGEIEKRLHRIMEKTSEDYQAKIASMEKKTWQ